MKAYLWILRKSILPASQLFAPVLRFHYNAEVVAVVVVHAVVVVAAAAVVHVVHALLSLLLLLVNLLILLLIIFAFNHLLPLKKTLP